MKKSDISLIINCSKEDIQNINISLFNSKYTRIYFNIKSEDKDYLMKILNDVETKYYSIWNYNNEYLGIDDLMIVLNKNYVELDPISNPDISVIVCLYNTPIDLFKNCLLSICNQTFKNFEVLIVNDGSTKYIKENRALVKSLNDNRFIWIDKEHSGKSQTLNLAFSKARGKYIAISDSDDQMFPDRLNYQFNFLEHNKYDVISNAMLTDDNHIIFPTNLESHEVNEENIAYSTMHPCMMLNKKNVINKVPFLFSQIYDSMEDCIFNFIMYYYGVTMWYDSHVLQIYSHKNENSVHYENVTMYLKKQYTYKITHKTFNYINNDPKKTTVVLLINNNWGTDIEKTILNIRLTTNNVNILVVNYCLSNIDLSYLNKYNVQILNLDIEQKKYNIALQIAINEHCKTKYCMIISKPCRFYTQEWDLLFERYYDKFKYPYAIIQPYIVGFDKIDENNYINEHGKEEYKVRNGLNLNLLDKNIFSKIKEQRVYSEYIFDVDIPIIDDDLIFFSSVDYLKMFIGGLNYFDNNTFISAYISIAACLKWGSSKIYKDIRCGCINNDNLIYTYIDQNEKKYNYYKNMFALICFFCKESKYIYEKILYDAFENKQIPKKIINDHIENIEVLNNLKNIITFSYDISYFFKKNNLDKTWILTNQPY